MGPSVDDVALMFEEAGLHPSVPLTIHSVAIRDNTAEIDLTLRYLEGQPVCCPEPGCYIPALRPPGLDLVLTRMQRKTTDRLVLDLSITVRQLFEPSFRFTEHAFEPKDEVLSYTHP